MPNHQRNLQAEVTTDNNETWTYIGITANDFKTRYQNNKKYHNETELSKHTWQFKTTNENTRSSGKSLNSSHPVRQDVENAAYEDIRMYFLLKTKMPGNLLQSYLILVTKLSFPKIVICFSLSHFESDFCMMTFTVFDQ